jgi:hypothetical protein
MQEKTRRKKYVGPTKMFSFNFHWKTEEICEKKNLKRRESSLRNKGPQGILKDSYLQIIKVSIFLSFLSIFINYCRFYQTTKSSFHFSFIFYSLSFIRQFFLLLSFSHNFTFFYHQNKL